MAGFNKVVLVGNLTRDPELRYTPSGTAVSDLRLAVTSRRRNGDETLFIDVTVWERQAETCSEYLSKGSSLLVEGRLRMDEWNDRENGQKRTRITVVAQNVQFLSGTGRGGGGQGGGYENRPAPNQQQRGQGGSGHNNQPPAQGGGNGPEQLDADFPAHDDVPF